MKTLMPLTKTRPGTTAESGFTLIELMIATTVLAVLLLLVTVIISSIGNLYYKGINQARIQDTTRTITNQVSQDLELSNGFTPTSNVPLPGNMPPAAPEAYCIGNVRYSFVVGAQLGSPTGSTHVIWRDTNPNPAGVCTVASGFPTSPATTGTELMAPNSRLTAFTIYGTSPYTITVNIAYGDDDLLCSPQHNSTCSSPNNTMLSAYYRDQDLLCKGRTGQNFCATANLTTTVVQRLTHG